MIDQCNTGLRLLTKTITTNLCYRPIMCKWWRDQYAVPSNSWVRTVERLPQAPYDKDAIYIVLNRSGVVGAAAATFASHFFYLCDYAKVSCMIVKSLFLILG